MVLQLAKYLLLVVVSIDQHMFSLIVNSLWSSCSVTMVNTPLVKYVYFLKDI